MSLLKLVVSIFLSVHTFLYHPSPMAMPIYRPVDLGLEKKVTLPVKQNSSVPIVRAQSALVIDQESGEELFTKSSDIQLFPASTTKIMSALVALERMDAKTVVTVPMNIPREGRVIHLIPGEQLTVKNLIEAMLIHSGNDAAVLLAQSYPGGPTEFVKAMNETAALLHMDKTNYQNSSGLFDPRHVTSVRDLLILSRAAMQRSEFRAIVAESKKTITSIDGQYSHELESTNKLLGKIDGMEGIKTGWIEEAGECFVTQVTRDGHTILIALLNSPDRFGEATTLIEWVYQNHIWETKTINEWIDNKK